MELIKKYMCIFSLSVFAKQYWGKIHVHIWKNVEKLAIICIFSKIIRKPINNEAQLLLK